MRRSIKLMTAVLLIISASMLFCQPVLAVSEGEVQEKIAAVGKEAVSGNVLIWFLCAIAFLKVSQKIDSFMSSLGINVGHTGGSMVAEAMIAARGIGSVKNFAGSHFRGGLGNGKSSPGGTGSGGFLSGGLAGVVSRSVVENARKNAADAAGIKFPGAMGAENGGTAGEGKSRVSASGQPHHEQHIHGESVYGQSNHGLGIGGRMYAASASKGGDFANNVISNIATGSMGTAGVMSGGKAAEALHSYMGYAALEPGAAHIPQFSGVEIGGGRIIGTETSDDHPGGIAFGMYHTAQYAPPDGNYSTVQTKDGASWYKQYAADKVDKFPYMAPDGSIAYKESIIRKLPPPPPRKDRI